MGSDCRDRGEGAASVPQMQGAEVKRREEESRERGLESGAFGRRRTAQLVCVLKLETEKAVH